MTDKSEINFAESLYQEGMKYNWTHNNSPSNSTLARIAFQGAAEKGHTKAMRELAEMIFQGSGGAKNQEQALFWKWSAFKKGDLEALEELSALLGSYAEILSEFNEAKYANKTAQKAEDAFLILNEIESYLHELRRSKITE